MSQENVEIVRHTYAAYERGDLSGALDNADPDLVPYRGHDEIRAFTHRFLATWDEVRIELGEPIEAAENVLVVENVTYLRGRDGIETQARSAWVLTFRDGQ